MTAVGKALSSPLRLDILHAVEGAGRTSPSEIAAQTPHELPNLSYHVRELHSVGLLRRAGTRQVRGAIENFYALTDEGKAAIEAINAVVKMDPKRQSSTRARRRARS